MSNLDVHRARPGTIGTAAVLVAMTAWMTGCAARAPLPAFQDQLGKAHNLVTAGCYQCLLEALAMYEQLTATRRAPVAEAQRAGVQAAVLLAVRARELGLPDAPFLERARALAAVQAPMAKSRTAPLPPPLSLAAYAEAVRLVAGETSGFPPERREERLSERRLPRDGSVPPARAALDSAIASDIVAQYLALAIDCEDPRARKELRADNVVSRYDTPLIRFRLALCAFGPDQLAGLRTADARWTDTWFPDGRREFNRLPAPNLSKAAIYLEAAHAAFPSSTAVTLLAAQAQNAINEYDAALARFDDVIGVYPTQREALLGRVMSLSYLARHAEAIATATQMIELGTYFVGDAYYWRAWNRYSLQALEPAWDDVERATKLMVNTAVYTLAGYIAYARQQLDIAIDRFSEAYRLDKTNCEAVYAEGLVHTDKSAWEPGGARFATAIGCFAGAAAQAEKDQKMVETAPDLDPGVRAKRIAALQKQIATAEQRRAQAAFNAASCYARLGMKSDALAYVDIAAEHFSLKDKAAGLKAAIEKLP